MSGLALRDYQTQALAAVEQEFKAGRQRTALVMATGLGKTITFAKPLAAAAQAGGRGACLVHRDELARQAVDKIGKVEPSLAGAIGTVKAKHNDVDAPIIVASTQTLAQRGRMEQMPALDFVVVDECHHYAADTFLGVLRGLGCFEPLGPRTLGVTATLARTDGRALGDVWESVAFERDVLWGIRNGHLVDARGIRVTLPDLNLDKVAYRQGDWQDGDLAKAMLEANAPAEIAKVYQEHAADRKGLVFTPSVELAHMVAAELEDIGISAASVWGSMPMEERRKVLDDAFRGRIQVLVNCMVLTEGFDWPEASAVVVARPTSSTPLYAQIVGRVLRTFPGKPDALVIDVTGVGSSHKLAGLTDLAGFEVREDESLEEAAEREEAEAKEPGMREIKLKVLRGKEGAADFDLFGASRRAWQQTVAGNWFISDGSFYYALPPGAEPGTFNVAKIPAKASGGEWLHEDMDISLAMAYAEQAATEAEGAKTLNYRKAAWRNAAPSETQKSLAKQLRIIGAESMTRGELSGHIDVVFASRRLDKLNMFKTRR